MSEYILVDGELYHYGIKGMKWGIRKKRPENEVDRLRADRRSAKKEFDRSFNKAYNRSIAAYSPIKKHREANARRWQDATNKAKVYEKANKAYKTAKKAQTKAIKEKTQEFNKNASFGEKIMYNNATRKRAASLIVKNNMSVEEATKRAQGEAKRNTAIILGVYAGVTMAQLYAMSR